MYLITVQTLSSRHLNQEVLYHNPTPISSKGAFVLTLGLLIRCSMYPGLFFSSSVLSCIEKKSYQFFICSLKSPCQEVIIMQGVYCFYNMLVFFTNLTGPFYTNISHFSDSYGQKNRLEMLTVLRMGVQGPHCQDITINKLKLQGTVIIQISFTYLFWTPFSFSQKSWAFYSVQ